MARQLPFDIDELIRAELFSSEDESLMHLYGMLGRREWLAQAVTISRAWYKACFPSLYRVIEIAPTDETTLDLLLRTLRRRSEFAALLRIRRPYDRPRRDARICPNNTTHRGWRFWSKETSVEARTVRCVYKFIALARICINLEELHFGLPSVPQLMPVMNQVESRLRRLIVTGGRDLDMWLLGYIRADWSNLRSLKLSMAQPLQLGIHWRQYFYLPDATVFASMTNLVELELLGFVEPEQLRDVLNAVRCTLRTLACYQICPDYTPAAWLAPVNATLRKLTLYMHYYGSLGGLSCLTSLRELHVVVQGTPPESYQGTCALSGPPSSVHEVN